MKQSLAAPVTLGFGLVLVVVLASAGVAYRNTLGLRESEDAVAHSSAIVAALEAVLSTVREAETGQRGFLITGNDDYLKPYQEASGHVRVQLDVLGALAGTHPEHGRRIAELEAKVAAKFAELDETIELRKAKGFEAARKVVLTNRGQKEMEGIVQLIGGLARDEQALLTIRTADARRSYFIALLAVGVTACANLATLAFAFRLIRREFQARSQSEEQYRDLVENANDIIYTHDLSGNLGEWNRAGERILGYKKEEIRAMNIARVIAPEQLERARQMTARKVTEGGRTAYELDLITKDGRRITVEISSRLAIQLGQPPIVQGMARDVTERKRWEEAMRQRAKELADADRAKDEFLAMLAHELRNPLAPVHNALEVLRIAGPDDQRLEWARGLIDRQVHHMARLVDDLLDVSRITRGKITLRSEITELSTIVARTVEMSRPLIESRRHHLEVNLPNQAILLEGDPTRLAQVLGNLLTNAAKYTDEGGRIWLTANRADGMALIRVRDSGIGIPSEMLQKVFDLFLQVESSLDRSQGGLGIGLTLVRRIVEMHGGTVHAHSEGPGQGSEFLVRLPVAETVEPTVPADEPSAGLRRETARPSRRILVADDNQDSADSLAMLLQLLGHVVRSVHDGSAALELSETYRPDVAILDLSMPGLSGYDVARMLRAHPGLHQMMLVALSGFGSDSDRQHSHEAGFDEHLVKPVDLAKLQALLDCLGGEKDVKRPGRSGSTVAWSGGQSP